MSAKQMRAAFTLIELLVVAVILVVLLGMLMPAIQKVRSAAQRLECAANLQQQGRALLNYNSTFGVLPPGRLDPSYDSAVANVKSSTGFTLLLPYIEEDTLYRKYDPTKSSTDGSCPANLDVVGTKIKLYTCPSAPEPAIDTIEAIEWWYDTMFACQNAREGSYLFCYYDTFNDLGCFTLRGAFGNQVTGQKGAGSARLRDIRDGLSTTIAIGETRRDHAKIGVWHDFGFRVQVPHWGSGHALAVAGGMVASVFETPINQKAGKNLEAQFWGGPTNPFDPEYHKLLWGGYGSDHAGKGANFLFCDGSVTFLHDNISYPVYQALGTIMGGENVNLN